MTVQEIADLVGGKVEGDCSISIKGACGIKEAQDGDVTFLENSRYQPLLKDTKAAAVIVSPDILVPKGKVVIRHKSPSLAFAKIMEHMFPPPVLYKTGVHSTAVLGNNVKLGKDVSIQPYVVIDDDAVIGDNTILGAGVFVGRDARIGSNTFIYPKVVVRDRVEIGNRCIVHSGSVIGSDGFGYATVEGIHHKIPQTGTVIIEDDVEIGANVAIDRARFGKTWIKKGTKIDNLVQIAHNVVIGENSIIVAQTGISGSVEVGKNVVLAGQSGLAGHITVGDNVVVCGRAGVTKSVPSGQTVSGYPAVLHTKEMRLQALVNRLPKLFEKIASIEKKLGIGK